MKRFILVALFWCSTATAADLVADYDFYLQPNKGNNYDNGMGYTIGLRHDIYRDLKGELDITNITDVDFPTESDVKGSWGELRGYGALYNLIFDLSYNKNLSFMPYVGAGPVWWRFRRNPRFQDDNVTVKVDPSFVMRAGLDIDIKIYDNWRVTVGAGWLDTTIGKSVTNSSGETMNLLDAGNHIGLRYKTFRIGIRKEF